MKVTRSRSSKDQGPQLRAPSLGDDTSPQPTYTDVKAMLEAARIEVVVQYEHLPLLCNELRTQYDEGMKECSKKVRKEARRPTDLLLARLRGERYVFNAFNKHRLGQANWRYYKNFPVPENIDARLTELGEDIDEDLESFPLRLEAVERGFDALTENLAPIYQAADYEALLINTTTNTHPRRSRNKGKATAKTSAKGTASSKQSRNGRPINNYDKLLGAPAPNLDYPVGNITIAEMAAFHPEAIKSCDVIDRFCRNGGTQASFAAMINHFRAMDRGPIENNTVLRSMQGSMRKRAKAEPGYAIWKVKIHHQFPQPHNFDPASVSVTGFSHSGDGKIKTSALPVLIRDMARGVNIFPTGPDALDLTRAVQYCLDHPDENWLYPDDYELLVSQLPHDEDLEDSAVGPLPVRAGHQDHAIISRYTAARQSAGVRTGHARRPKTDRDSDNEDTDIVDTDSDGDLDDEVQCDASSRKEKKRKRSVHDSDSDEFDTLSAKLTNKRKKLTPKPRKSRQSRNATKDTAARRSHVKNGLFDDDLDTDSDGDTYVEPKKATKVKKQIVKPRRSGRATTIKHTYNIDEATVLDDEHDEMLSSICAMGSDMSDSDVFDEED
jgi:hypothetical protein